MYVRKSRDFSLTSLVSYSIKWRDLNTSHIFLGEKLFVNVSLNITNFANCGGKTDVCLFMDDDLLDKATVVFSKGNETKHVEFDLTVDKAGNHSLKVCVDCNDTVKEFNETNNCRSINICVHKGNDFAVTNITFKPSEPLIGDIIEINATIANFGNRGGSTIIEFYDNKSIELKRTREDYSGGRTINDVIRIPEALKIRVHFSYIAAGSYIKIYEGDNPIPIAVYNTLSDISDNWTEWCDGDTIRIESHFGEFTVDRYEAMLPYEAMLANETVNLSAGTSTNIPSVLNLTSQEFGWAINGTHNITVKVDPYNQVDELNETNNARTVQIDVNPSLDFAVTNIYFEPEGACS
ncbi:MAG: hypothetical protein MW690_001648 [Methanophagales archaeon]|nr:hypothetical protein [Methanophagales archaeon]